MKWRQEETIVEIKVLNESYNPVMKRKEIRVEVAHTSAGTPERFSTRKILAEWFNAKLDNLYITDMITGTGTQRTVCNVELYDDQNVAARIVPKHIRTRNLPAEERKKLKEEQKVEKKEVKPPAEKPEKPEKAEKKPEKLEKPEKKEEKPSEKKVEEKPAEKKPEKKEVKKEAPKAAKTK
jgi:ribosomal protein S24E